VVVGGDVGHPRDMVAVTRLVGATGALQLALAPVLTDSCSCHSCSAAAGALFPCDREISREALVRGTEIEGTASASITSAPPQPRVGKIAASNPFTQSSVHYEALFGTSDTLQCLN